MPQEYRFILRHKPCQQLGFNLLPAFQSRVSAGTEAGLQVKGKEGGAARSFAQPGPRSLPVTAARTAPPSGELARPSRGTKARGATRTPGSRPAQPGPSPALALRSPSQLLCAGVRYSDPPSPRGGNSSCRSAAGFTSSSAKESATVSLPAPEGPSPRAGSPYSPASATAASYTAAAPAPGARKQPPPPAAARMRGDVALRGGWKGEGKRGEEGAPVLRPRPPAGLPPHGHAPSSALRRSPLLAAVTHVVAAQPCGLGMIRLRASADW